MTGIEQLLSVSHAYAAATQLSLATVSDRVFDDGKKLKALESGAGIGVGRFERAMEWFSSNWPASAEWPVDVPRPESAEVAE